MFGRDIATIPFLLQPQDVEVISRTNDRGGSWRTSSPMRHANTAVDRASKRGPRQMHRFERVSRVQS
jgi:hypothetical protein